MVKKHKIEKAYLIFIILFIVPVYNFAAEAQHKLTISIKSVPVSTVEFEKSTKNLIKKSSNGIEIDLRNSMQKDSKTYDGIKILKRNVSESSKKCEARIDMKFSINGTANSEHIRFEPDRSVIQSEKQIFYRIVENKIHYFFRNFSKRDLISKVIYVSARDKSVAKIPATIVFAPNKTIHFRVHETVSRINLILNRQIDGYGRRFVSMDINPYGIASLKKEDLEEIRKLSDSGTQVSIEEIVVFKEKEIKPNDSVEKFIKEIFFADLSSHNSYHYKSKYFTNEVDEIYIKLRNYIYDEKFIIEKLWIENLDANCKVDLVDVSLVTEGLEKLSSYKSANDDNLRQLGFSESYIRSLRKIGDFVPKLVFSEYLFDSVKEIGNDENRRSTKIETQGRPYRDEVQLNKCDFQGGCTINLESPIRHDSSFPDRLFITLANSASMPGSLIGSDIHKVTITFNRGEPQTILIAPGELKQLEAYKGRAITSIHHMHVNGGSANNFTPKILIFQLIKSEFGQLEKNYYFDIAKHYSIKEEDLLLAPPGIINHQRKNIYKIIVDYESLRSDKDRRCFNISTTSKESVVSRLFCPENLKGRLELSQSHPLLSEHATYAIITSLKITGSDLDYLTSNFTLKTFALPLNVESTEAKISKEFDRLISYCQGTDRYRKPTFEDFYLYNGGSSSLDFSCYSEKRPQNVESHFLRISSEKNSDPGSNDVSKNLIPTWRKFVSYSTLSLVFAMLIAAFLSRSKYVRNTRIRMILILRRGLRLRSRELKLLFKNYMFLVFLVVTAITFLLSNGYFIELSAILLAIFGYCLIQNIGSNSRGFPGANVRKIFVKRSRCGVIENYLTLALLTVVFFSLFTSTVATEAASLVFFLAIFVAYLFSLREKNR